LQRRNSKEIIEYCNQHELSLFDYALSYEKELTDRTEEMILSQMKDYWIIMKDSVQNGLHDFSRGEGRIIKRKAKDVYDLALTETAASGSRMLKAVAYGLAVMEVNVTMGHIVAAPTAGASGILPGVFLSLQETFHLDDDRIIEGLFVAGMIGSIIAKNASISGAKGGCQAEVGSGAAMAAGAGVYMLKGSQEEVFSAAAIAIKNLMGLVCDPVAGLVEVPCQKRNGIGITNSLMAIDLIRAKMYSYIPFDEVVVAMKEVGDLMPACHRETGTGGIANSKTGIAMKKEIFHVER